MVMRDLASNVLMNLAVTPTAGAAGTTEIDGTAVNMNDYDAVIFIALIGTLSASAVTTSCACFFVATNMILRPERTIARIACEASSRLEIVLLRSMMWIPFFSIKMYGAIFGSHLRVK